MNQPDDEGTEGFLQQANGSSWHVLLSGTLLGLVLTGGVTGSIWLTQIRDTQTLHQKEIDELKENMLLRAGHADISIDADRRLTIVEERQNRTMQQIEQMQKESRR
jgi:hypothetical protein